MTKKKPQSQFPRLPSEDISRFLDCLEWCQKIEGECFQAMKKEDDIVQDFLHEFEFEEDCDKRSKIATRLHNSRKQRRKVKDLMKLTEKMSKFATDTGNRGFLKRLRQLEKEQLAVEQYLQSERSYKPKTNGYTDPREKGSPADDLKIPWETDSTPQTVSIQKGDDTADNH